MASKWMTERYDTTITEVECLKESEKFVTIRLFDWKGQPYERRLARTSCYDNYFDTWEQAHSYLLGRTENRLTAAHLELQKAQGEYGNVKGMKKPEVGDER